MRNKFLKTQTIVEKLALNKREKKILFLVIKVKKEYCSNLIQKNVVDNKSFWKSVKLLFTE